MRLKISWASLRVGSKFTVFALFYIITLYLRAIFPLQAPRAYIWRGDLTEGFCTLPVWGLIFGRVYTWRGLFSEFYGNLMRFAIILQYANMAYHVPRAYNHT